MKLEDTKKTATVGALVSRFQVHELTQGHRDLIETVCARHKKVVILLGVRPDLKGSINHPLSFDNRKTMIEEEFFNHNIVILPLHDHPSDDAWSQNVDAKIKEVFQTNSVLLYGARDSFIPYYSGQFDTVELEAHHTISGTEIREMLADNVIAHPYYRAGIIASAYDAYPISYQVVDVAVINAEYEVLCARKHTDPQDKYRVIGGFVDPTDASLEAAAKREVNEETGLEIGDPVYAGSCRINDWRYRGERSQIMSSFFIAPYIFGNPKANDDICETKWIPLNELSDNLIEGHKQFIPMIEDKFHTLPFS